MAGHSHWAQVKHKKAVVDVKRGQLISKLLRAITIAARDGSDPETNYKLRSAIERAKSFQVPLENIERAIKKVETESQNLEEVIFEAYLGEIQILIKGITDNKNRTLGDIKSVLNKYEAKLAEPGAVRWNFQEKIKVVIDKSEEEKILEFLDLFEDFQEKENEIILIASSEKNDQIKKIFQDEQINVKEYSYELKPLVVLENLDKNLKEKLDKLIEDLLNLDDIEEVYTNT
jgi:YebC/PmpR family DNA-binding regulatory protein